MSLRGTDGARPSIVLTARSTRTWSQSVFRLVAQGTPRRRPSDIVRIVTAIAAVVATGMFASRTGQLEQTLYDLFIQLPGAARGAFRSVIWLLAAIGIGAALAALATRRLRLGGTILTAAALAWGISVAITQLFDVATTRTAAGFVALNGTVPVFPAVKLSIVIAAALAAGPYLTRPVRRLLELIIPMAMLGTIFMLQGFPSDVAGALAVGWGCAAIAHLAFGTPAGTPTKGDVERSLEALGVRAREIAIAPIQSWGATRFTAVDDEGSPLAIEVIGRDATDAQLLASVWRAAWYKDAGSSDTLTRRQRVEHEAYLTLMAERAGVPVADLVAAGSAGPHDDALLVTRLPEGTSFAAFQADEISEADVAAAWRTLQVLHGARLAHGGIGVESLIRRGDGTVALLDLSRALSGASEGRQELDRLALLVSTAQAAGTDRAVVAAERALGRDALVALLPVMQPSALAAATRRRPPQAKQLLAELRDEVLDRTGAEPPEITELRRVSPGSLLMAAATVLGIYLLAAQLASIDDLWATVTSADPAWVVVVILCAQVPQFTSAVTVLGAVDRRLPYGPVVALQYANGFTGLIGGTVANAALIVRFFQKQGLAAGVAISSGVLWGVAGFIVQVVLVVICLFWASPDLSEFDAGAGGGSTWLLLIVAAGAVIGMALAVPRVRHLVIAKAKPQVTDIVTNLRGVMSTPRKAVQLFGGALGSQIFFALALAAAVHAYGGSVAFPAVVLTNSFASMVGGMAPIPGGMGVTEAGMIAGLTAAGVPQETAVAATLLQRTFCFYLPPIWGWFSLRWLKGADYL
jgi:uncharacterized membrane protein YbhN (UPF0104 family)